jgi:hypothetical protein
MALDEPVRRFERIYESPGGSSGVSTKRPFCVHFTEYGKDGRGYGTVVKLPSEIFKSLPEVSNNCFESGENVIALSDP